MIRLGVLAAGAAVVAGAALVTAASIPPKPTVGVTIPVGVKATVLGQKIGFFNIAKVMRNYDRAKTAVARLNDRRVRMSANLLGLRGMYTELQVAVQNEKLKPVIAANPDHLEQMTTGMVLLARRVEDLDRECNRLLNNQASEVIGELHDEIRGVVVDLAREHGLSAVMAYPDATTPEEANNPMVKEMRLKPPAAHPFYLDPSVDYTDELLERLNARFAANGGK